MHIILWIGMLSACTALFTGAGRAIAGARFERGLRASNTEQGALVLLRAIEDDPSASPASGRRSA